MHNLGSSAILADEQNFYKSYIYPMSLGMEQPYNIIASTIQLLWSDVTLLYMPTFEGKCTRVAGLIVSYNFLTAWLMLIVNNI